MTDEQKEKLKKEAIRADTIKSVLSLVAVLLVCLMGMISPYMAENWFSYTVEKTKEIEEPYEIIVDRIWDYTCYITTYGEKYHEKGCYYLRSSHKTTVEEAINNGYTACSKCDPPRELPVVIKETRYRNVTKTISETKEPKVLVWIICSAIITILYYLISKPLDDKVTEARKQGIRI